jgi:hypothetical protein
MGDVAEEHADERTSGEPDPGAAVQPSASAQFPAPEPPPSEEQLRQFQQFQQFQDYLRYTETQQHMSGGALVPDQGRPPVPPPHQGGELVADQNRQPALRPKMPGWLSWLVRKIVGWAIALLLIGLAATWAYHHYFPSTTAGTDTKTVTDSGGGTYHTNQVLSTDPYDAVAKVYKGVAAGLPVDACGRFSTAVQAKFATDMGYADGNCQTAVLGLRPQVTDPDAYYESISNVSSTPQTATMTINSCDFSIQGGPALGTFIVTKVDLGQWLITGHTPGPTQCAAPSPSTTPTTP